MITRHSEADANFLHDHRPGNGSTLTADVDLSTSTVERIIALKQRQLVSIQCVIAELGDVGGGAR